MGVFLETANNSQTKLIGEGSLIREQEIGYSNLTFEAKKGQKKQILSFRPLKRIEGLKIQS